MTDYANRLWAELSGRDMQAWDDGRATVALMAPDPVAFEVADAAATTLSPDAADAYLAGAKVAAVEYLQRNTDDAFQAAFRAWLPVDDTTWRQA